jgi:hypothetical protein
MLAKCRSCNVCIRDYVILISIEIKFVELVPKQYKWVVHNEIVNENNGQMGN